MPFTVNTSDKHDHEQHHHHGDDTEDNLLEVGSFVLSAIICLGNSITLVAIARNRKLRTIPNLYIGSLALADLMVGLMLLVQGLTETSHSLEHQGRKKNFCLVRMSMLFVSVAASMLSYLLVACDRYLYIMHSLKYVQLVTRQRSLLVILAGWLMAGVYGTVPAYANNYTMAEGCTPTHVFPFWYMIVIHPIFYLTLAALTFWLYLRIVSVALQQQRRIRDQEASVGHSSGQSSTKVSQRTWKVIKMLILVSGFFFLCWCPLLVLAFLEYTIHVEHQDLEIASLVAIMNSGVNFLVLAIMREDFRAEFQRMFCLDKIKWICGRRQTKVSPVLVSTIASSHWISSND